MAKQISYETESRLLKPMLSVCDSSAFLYLYCFGGMAHNMLLACRTHIEALRESVGYVKTQLSFIPYIILTTTCFGHCGPSSGHKSVYRGKTIQSMHILNFQRDLVVGWIIHIELKVPLLSRI